MPLHLLGKKSWNPYAPAAIARVRADEEAAALREEADDQRKQEEDAQRRLAILRGEEPPPPAASPTHEDDEPRGQKRRHDDGERREKRQKRRLQGEDDTDRDIRLARRDVESHGGRELKLSDERIKGVKARDAPITDHAGHIQLFAPKQVTQTEKNAEAEAERKRKEQELEDQYTMRFSNAAGYKKGVKDAPWYAAGRGHTGTESLEDPDKFVETIGTNAFGREDPGRYKRDAVRATKSDPMAMMKQAQGKLKEANRRRDEVNRERERQLQLLKDEQERMEKRKKRRHERPKEADDLEGFSLDAHEPMSEHKYERRHRHHHGNESRERSKHEGRHRHHGHGHRSHDYSQTDRNILRPSHAHTVGLT